MTPWSAHSTALVGKDDLEARLRTMQEDCSHLPSLCTQGHWSQIACLPRFPMHTLRIRVPYLVKVEEALQAHTPGPSLLQTYLIILTAAADLCWPLATNLSRTETVLPPLTTSAKTASHLQHSKSQSRPLDSMDAPRCNCGQHNMI